MGQGLGLGTRPDTFVVALNRRLIWGLALSASKHVNRTQEVVYAWWNRFGNSKSVHPPVNYNRQKNKPNIYLPTEAVMHSEN